MVRTLTLIVLALALSGCAAFKELSPKPELLPGEGGYIELKNDKENFMLEKGKKYFIKFPGPGAQHFYVVMHYRAKSAMHTVFTSSFDDGPGPLAAVADEASLSDTVSVYAVEPAMRVSYWVIDTVSADIEMMLSYRYVPQWRYTFENKYASFRETELANRADRSVYITHDQTVFDRLDYPREVGTLSDRSGVMNSVRDQLVKLQTIFPSDIAARKDTAYEKYLLLRRDVEDEIAFQNKFATVLNVFQKEKNTRSNTGEFLEAAEDFASFLDHSAEYPAPIVERTRTVLSRRMNEGMTYYDGQIRQQNGTTSLRISPAIGPVIRLAKGLGSPTAGDLQSADAFVARFNTEWAAQRKAEAKLREIYDAFARNTARPDVRFFQNTQQSLNDIRTSIPEVRTGASEKYKNYSCTVGLTAAIQSTSRRASDLQTLFQSGAQITGEIDAQSWSGAETHTRLLASQTDLLDPATSTPVRDRLVHWAESDIFAGVQRASEARVDAFTSLHELSVEDVPRLYADSVFKPVYLLTYSSLGQSDLQQKRSKIDGYLMQKKYYQFPESAIKAIYREFGARISERGVEKARAIVAHGSMYRGSDKALRRLVSECDVNEPKSIEHPKEYRRVFALPSTSNAKGVNEYMFRVRIQVPTDAKFPVFDVNIKLPPEIVGKSGSEQWYDRITIDNVLIKNEGRFLITAPVAANNYECQITPVQMDQKGGHVLEIRFKYSGFRVFEVSAMAQVPIIRKN